MGVDVLFGPAQAARQLDARDEAAETGQQRERRPAEDLLVVAREHRHEARQIGRRPLTGLVALPDREPAGAGEAREEARIVHLHDRRLGGRVAEAPHAVGSANLERALGDAGERALEHAARGGSDQAGPRARRSSDGLALDPAHVGTEPCSGSKGGLRWNGTRLRQSLSACQWMRAMICPVTHG